MDASSNARLKSRPAISKATGRESADRGASAVAWRLGGVEEACGKRMRRGFANAMTIDVEDYFQVEAFASTIDRSDWESLPRRVERNTERLLQILAESRVEATFFILGWVAERH